MSIFHRLGPLGRVGLLVAMCFCLFVCLSDVPSLVLFFLFSVGGGMLMVMPKAYLIGIGASIRIGRESRCLPYAGFLKTKSVDFNILRTQISPILGGHFC